jgi:tRNA U34 2-thiouridine synthase MnmA/TrmU
LRTSIFPVGGFTKDIVKKVAASNGFEDVAKKKESMGICFIGKRKNGFQKFIAEYLEEKPGDIIDIDSGKVFATSNAN